MIALAVQKFKEAFAALNAGADALDAASREAAKQGERANERNLSEKAIAWRQTAKNMHAEYEERYLTQPRYEKYQA